MSLLIASSLEEVLVALSAGARPIAGGTDLVVGARHGKAPLPHRLVAIDRVEELRQIEMRHGALVVGAAVTHQRLERDPLVAGQWTCLADASALVGSPATRHLGTIGGNVMNGSPAMDTGAPLVVLNATAELRSSRGARHVSMSELWVGVGRTSAAPDELCIAVHLPARVEGSGSAYVRLEYRRAMEIAVVGAAASVILDQDGTVRSVAAALTAVSPTILAVEGIDELDGATVREAAEVVAARASAQAAPISDLRASDRYRRHCVGVMARRAVEAAARRAAGEALPVPVNRSLGIGAAS
ncbi:MAG: Carbon monoxide dehydrogenase medium chain [Actinomycetota bacterium]|jgi:CO/xanthine dehydrogenase FAD-binding subunit